MMRSLDVKCLEESPKAAPVAADEWEQDLIDDDPEADIIPDPRGVGLLTQDDPIRLPRLQTVEQSLELLNNAFCGD